MVNINMTFARNPFKTKQALKKPSLKIYPSSWISVLIKQKVIPRYNKLEPPVGLTIP